MECPLLVTSGNCSHKGISPKGDTRGVGGQVIMPSDNAIARRVGSVGMAGTDEIGGRTWGKMGQFGAA